MFLLGVVANTWLGAPVFRAPTRLGLLAGDDEVRMVVEAVVADDEALSCSVRRALLAWAVKQRWKDKIRYVTRSREMSHLSKMSIFSHYFLITSKCFILMQIPLQLDIWLQSYEGFVNAKNNIKQRNLNTVFANISKTASPTSAHSS